MRNSMLQYLQYGDRQIRYVVKFRLPKETRRVSIHVNPDGVVEVDAPLGADRWQVKTAVQKRARWIISHLGAADRNHENVHPRRYVSGESYFYLGRRHVLKVVETDSQQCVKLLRGQLHVATHDTSQDCIRRLMRSWYRSLAYEVFQRRLELLVADIVWLDEVPSFKLLTMRKQWGSCSPNGLICVNPNLVKAPRDCIDYVLLHELCHLKEHNHGRGFYKLLAAQMHNWQAVKGRLDDMAELLLNE